MTAAAKPKVSETEAAERAEFERVQRHLRAPEAKLPQALWEACADAALATYERQRAEDAVRQAEVAYRELLRSDATSEQEASANYELSVARKALVTRQYCENLAQGTVIAVRTRVELLGKVPR